MKDIKLDINTKQYDGKKIIDIIDLSVNGNIYIKNKETYIIYKEENVYTDETLEFYGR